jgi:predicted cupin superfamily sugar epimerase
MIDALAIRKTLNLQPLPVEGGYYRESYRSELELHPGALPDSFHGSRSAATAIYYLLTPDTFSALHRLGGDEVFHFYMGDPVEMLLLHSDASTTRITLGPDLAAGMHVQVIVPGGTWQGSRLRGGGRFALLGTTMTPGFDFQDFEAGSADDLCATYPTVADEIRRLTR